MYRSDGREFRGRPHRHRRHHRHLHRDLPGHTAHATVLIEAYLPGASLARTEDPLLGGLLRDGAVAEEVLGDPAYTHRSGLLTVTPADGRILDPSLGGPHPRRIALGAPTNSRSVAAFARPRSDAPAFRQNDAVARDLLRALRAPQFTSPTAASGPAVGAPAPLPPPPSRR
uniref:hypothetical protein n=1 Tax=Streptomyces polyasparticus TaxID=2767826 RepID=UPI001F3F0E8B|nr:hypothetical protein [Streptomyces polyasparticus]